ncbi:MAG: hypothetical protein AAFO29_25965 [Actinomycetota bacterium]
MSDRPEPPPPGRSRRLSEAIETLWSTMADDYGLLPDLAVDALLARADRGELAEASPRLLELLVGHELTIEDGAGVVERLGRHRWEPAERDAVTEALDGWWLQTLKRPANEHAPEYPVAVVLGILVGFGAPMVRWLGPWLDELDGPGAAHLASVVIGGPDGLSGPAWEGKADEARQVLNWARTETVVNGLALVGGVHLEDGVLDQVLDRLIS